MSFSTPRPLLMLLLASVLGCSADPSDEPGASSSPAAGETTAEAGSPDAAVMAVVNGMKANHPEAIWDFLPTSYQADINQLVQQFASSMDDEVWSQGFKVARKLVRILREKRELIMADPQVSQAMAASSVEATGLSENWELVLGLVQTLLDSDLSDLERLRRFDGGNYLAKTGGSLMTQLQNASATIPEDPFQKSFKDKLGNVAAEVVAVTGDKAVVKLTNADGQAEEVEFVQVEQKWIPASLANSWKLEMDKMRAGMGGIQPGVQEAKPQVMQVIATIDATLDRIDGAETTEEFQTVIQEAMLPLMMVAGMMAGGGAGPADSGNETDENAARILIPGRFEQAEAEELADQVLEVLSSEESGLEDASMFYFYDDKELTITVSPVEDLDALSKQIKFGKVTEIDLSERTITVMPKDE